MSEAVPTGSAPAGSPVPTDQFTSAGKPAGQAPRGVSTSGLPAAPPSRSRRGGMMGSIRDAQHQAWQQRGFDPAHRPFTRLPEKLETDNNRTNARREYIYNRPHLREGENLDTWQDRAQSRLDRSYRHRDFRTRAGFHRPDAGYEADRDRIGYARETYQDHLRYQSGEISGPPVGDPEAYQRYSNHLEQNPGDIMGAFYQSEDAQAARMTDRVQSAIGGESAFLDQLAGRTSGVGDAMRERHGL